MCGGGRGGGSFENKENRTKLLKGYEIFPAELTCISSILTKFLKTVFGGTNIVWKFGWKLKSFEKNFVWGVRTFLQLSEKSSHSPLYKMEVPLRHCVILSIISVIPYFNGWNYLQNMLSSDTVTAVTSSVGKITPLSSTATTEYWLLCLYQSMIAQTKRLTTDYVWTCFWCLVTREQDTA